MKKLLVFAIVVAATTGCKKDSTTTPQAIVPQWTGTYHSVKLVNDSTKTGAGAYVYNPVTVETNNDIDVELFNGEIALGPISTIYGLTYFYNAKTNWVQTQPREQSYLKGSISGNSAVILDPLSWTINGSVHTLISTSLKLNSDNSLDFSYSEQINTSPVIYLHYSGHYTK